MKELHKTIDENITYFWNNDPILDHENDIEKLWNAFFAWCFQNIMELYDDIHPVLICIELDSKRDSFNAHSNK